MIQSSIHADQTNDTIVYGLPYSLLDYSAFSAHDRGTEIWLPAVYGSLIRRASSNNRDWAPDLVTTMPVISNGGKTFTFQLKNDLFFSNGQPLTSDDVEFSLHMALTPDVNKHDYSQYSGFIDNNSISIISSTSFSITLLSAYAFPYGLMAFPIVPYETYHQQYESCLNGVIADCTFNNPDGSSSISAGPFEFLSYEKTVSDEQITLTANPFWYDADIVKTNTLIMQKIADKAKAIQALTDGSIDIMDSQYVPGLNELSGISGIRETFVGNPQSQEMAINNLNPYFGTGMMIPNTISNDPANKTLGFENARLLRHALSAIMNRDLYVTQILQGLAEPAASIMPSAALGWDPTIKPEAFNITRAKEIMTSLGFNFTSLGTPDANGVYPTSFFNIVVLSINTNPALNEWSNVYSAELPKIGIGVISHVSTGMAEINPRSFLSKVNPPSYSQGGYDVLFWGRDWSLDWNPNGLFDASGSCTTGSCRNIYNFDLGENMTLLAQHIHDYLTALDFDYRLMKVSTVQQDIAYYLPTIPILYPQSHWAWADDVQGLDPLLLSVTNQEWNNVYKAGFSNNLKQTPPPPEALTISGPSDQTISFGSTGNVISWTVPESNSLAFEIIRDDQKILSGEYYGISTISISVDGLAIGQHIFVFTLKDLYENSVNDTVIITVVESTTSGNSGSSTKTSNNNQGFLPVPWIFPLTVLTSIAILYRKKR